MKEQLQWRWEHKYGVWGPWTDSKEVAVTCAKDPDMATGRVQERVKPDDNDVSIERVS